LKKSIYKNLLALLLFALVSFVYFFPVLEGYSLKMSDISTFLGMSKEISDFRTLFGEEPLWTGAMFSGMPAFQISVNYAMNTINYLYKLVLAFPRPAEFIFAYALGFFILLRTLKVEYKISIFGALAFALSSYFIVIILAGHSSKAYAIAFMAPVLAGFILSYNGKVLQGIALAGIAMALELRANHIQVTYYLGFILLFYVIAELVKAYKNDTLPLFIRRSLALGVVMLLAIFANFGNLYNTIVYSKYSTRGPTELTIKADGSSNQDIVTSGLDKEYVTDWSYGIEESLTFIIPDAKGGATGSLSNDADAMKGVNPQARQFVSQNNRYWGNQRYTAGPVYLGIIIVFLFFLGLATIRSRFKWVMLGLGIFALALGWGKNFMWLTEFFLNYVPGYNKFRAVTIILVVVELVTPLLAILYLNRIFLTPAVLGSKFVFKGKDYGNKFYVVSGVFAFVLLLFYLSPDSFLEFFSKQEMDYFATQLSGDNSQMDRLIDALKETRINIFKADVLRSLAFFIVAFASILLYKTKTISNSALVYILGIFMVIDLWGVDKRYLNNDKSNGQYVHWEKKKDNDLDFLPSKADLTILNRELTINSENPGLSEKVESELAIAAKEKKELGKGLARLSLNEENDIRFRTLNFNSDFRVLNISVSTFNDASTSYFFKSIGGYHGAKLKSYQEMIEFEIQPEIQELVNRLQNGVPPHIAFENMNALNMLNTQYLIYNQNADPVENPSRLGPAWFVNEINWVTSADEEILAIKDTDPAKIAIIREDFLDLFTGINPTSNEDKDIRLKDYKPNRLVYEADVANSELAVFSEIFYPKGWKATIDGKESEIIRVNYILRGLIVPSGKHEIVFSFEPKGYVTANVISLVSSSLLLLFGLWVLAKLFSGKLQSRIE
jgi:hypothetical protein